MTLYYDITLLIFLALMLACVGMWHKQFDVHQGIKPGTRPILQVVRTLRVFRYAFRSSGMRSLSTHFWMVLLWVQGSSLHPSI